MDKKNLIVDKTWLRNFADKNGITFKQLTTEICPNTSEETLRGLWKKRYAASGIYKDALIWYAKAKQKHWEEITC